MAEYSKYLGESIYRNRKRQRMTQAELAEKAGVTEQTIRKIEKMTNSNIKTDTVQSV